MPLIEKQLQNFDFDKIKADTLKIIEANPCLSQIGLTHSNAILTEQEKILESVGSILDETGSMRFKETDFVNFNDAYKDTSLYEMYTAIPNLGRFRIMIMDGPKCYTIHRDLTKRYHYVLETNANCIFLFPGLKLQFHLPADGILYKVDTTNKHTFVNGSKERRIHLVIDDISTL